MFRVRLLTIMAMAMVVVWLLVYVFIDRRMVDWLFLDVNAVGCPVECILVQVGLVMKGGGMK